MDYSIKINEFEGPLDLLLHLIKEDNIDIYNISIDLNMNVEIDIKTPYIYYRKKDVYYKIFCQILNNFYSLFTKSRKS